MIMANIEGHDATICNLSTILGETYLVTMASEASLVRVSLIYVKNTIFN
jgi:hypothetical protein